jgi:hypothetical protein
VFKGIARLFVATAAGAGLGAGAALARRYLLGGGVAEPSVYVPGEPRPQTPAAPPAPAPVIATQPAPPAEAIPPPGPPPTPAAAQSPAEGDVADLGAARARLRERAAALRAEMEG